MEKSVLNVTISRLVGLIVFLVLLSVANVLYFNSSIYLEIVSFLNAKILIIILFSLLLYLGELFFIFGFPFNFPSPIFNAFGGAILVGFIFDCIILGVGFAGLDLSFVLRILEIVVVILVFILAIIVGYVKVFSSVGAKSRKRKETRKKVKKEESEWEEVKEEIKDAFHDAGENIKKAIHPEEEKPKSKKKSSKKKTTKKKSSKKKK